MKVWVVWKTVLWPFWRIMIGPYANRRLAEMRVACTDGKGMVVEERDITGLVTVCGYCYGTGVGGGTEGFCESCQGTGAGTKGSVQ